MKRLVLIILTFVMLLSVSACASSESGFSKYTDGRFCDLEAYLIRHGYRPVHSVEGNFNYENAQGDHVVITWPEGVTHYVMISDGNGNMRQVGYPSGDVSEGENGEMINNTYRVMLTCWMAPNQKADQDDYDWPDSDMTECIMSLPVEAFDAVQSFVEQ